MATTTKPEYRELPTFLVKQKRFCALSTEAKATYLTLALTGTSYGLGQINSDEAFASLVGYALEEFRSAIAELCKAKLVSYDGDAGVYWLHDCNSLNLKNDKHVKFLKRTLQDFPPSSLVNDFIEANEIPSECHPKTKRTALAYHADEEEGEGERAKPSQPKPNQAKPSQPRQSQANSEEREERQSDSARSDSDRDETPSQARHLAAELRGSLSGDLIDTDDEIPF